MKKVNSYFIKFYVRFPGTSLCILKGLPKGCTAGQIVRKIFNIFTKTFVIPHVLCYNISVCQ